MIKNFLFIAVLFIMFTACNPSRQLNHAVAERKQQAVQVQIPSQPKATPADINMVYDYENIFSATEEKQLDSLLRNFEKSNLIPIKLVTLGALHLQNQDFDANSALLYKEWDVVHGKSGRGMIIAISTGMQKSKVDYGPFVAKFITENDIAAVVQQTIPIMQRGDFFEGAWSGLNRMMDIIRSNVGK